MLLQDLLEGVALLRLALVLEVVEATWRPFYAERGVLRQAHVALAEVRVLGVEPGWFPLRMQALLAHLLHLLRSDGQLHFAVRALSLLQHGDEGVRADDFGQRGRRLVQVDMTADWRDRGCSIRHRLLGRERLHLFQLCLRWRRRQTLQRRLRSLLQRGVGAPVPDLRQVLSLIILVVEGQEEELRGSRV